MAIKIKDKDGQILLKMEKYVMDGQIIKWSKSSNIDKLLVDRDVFEPKEVPYNDSGQSIIK